MNSDCQRWTDLSDRQAIGQPLDDEASRFLRDHARVCDECSRESALWRSLLARPVAALPAESEAASVLSRAMESAARERRDQRRFWSAAGAGALALAAGVALWIARGPTTVGPSRMSAADSASTAAAASGAKLSAARKEPPALEHPTACTEVLTGILTCEEAGTVITRRELASAQRVIELGRGRIVASLLPQPKGTSFSIATPAGRVTAEGTVFSVEIKDDGATVLQVVEGKVAVLATGAAQVQLVRAGEALRLGDRQPAALTAAERGRDLALLPPERRAALERASSAATGAAEPGTTAAEALLEEAVALRARGKFRRAAEVYRKIHQLSPASAVGGTALVSLGELSLSSLGDPAGALAAFDAYLAKGGALSQEAAFGRARALRALHRTADERAAIKEFLARYPDGVQSRALRQRLDALPP